MRFRTPASLFALGLLATQPAAARAGMPSVNLTEVARLRLDAISFFLVGFLVCAGLIQLLWNYLRKDFTSLPRLTYGKAVGLVALWGLLFVLVLTMISGARELMTPGAWKKDGLTYRLADAKPEAGAAESLELARHKQLDRLRVALWRHARAHEGRFPPDRTVSDIPREAWQVPDLSGLPYVYVGGLRVDQDRPLAYEPEVFGLRRLVLFANGEIREMEWEEIARALAAEKRG
jgi:hypothetical protein